jgi:hypothetical protein
METFSPIPTEQFLAPLTFQDVFRVYKTIWQTPGEAREKLFDMLLDRATTLQEVKLAYDWTDGGSAMERRALEKLKPLCLDALGQARTVEELERVKRLTPFRCKELQREIREKIAALDLIELQRDVIAMQRDEIKELLRQQPQ